MLNFLRPVDEPIKRDLIFTSDKNYTMKFKTGGEDYLKKMASGYISFFRGNIPFTFETWAAFALLLGGASGIRYRK